MSITVSNCQQICRSPLNNSPTKNLWTFSKSERFGKLSNPTFCSQAFYNLPSAIEKRAAGIGKGNKVDFTKVVVNTPSPQQYNLVGDTQLNVKKNKGYKFGESRDKMASTGILGGLNLRTPAPGTYQLGSTLSEIRYTMRPKPSKTSLVSNANVPGPGKYESLPAINEKGRYPISKYHNSCATLINPKQSKRFQDDYETLAPGPGKYALDKTGIQENGRYFVSKYHDSNVRSFPKENRRTGSNEKQQTPAPGNYRLPSEFGYYQSSRSVGHADQK